MHKVANTKLTQVFLLMLILLVGFTVELHAEQEFNAIEAYNQALKLIKAGQLDKAIQQLEKILDKNPVFNRAYFKLIEIRRSQGQSELVREYFERLYNSHQNSLACYGLALCYKSKERDKAIKYIIECIDRNPNFTPAYSELVENSLALNQVSVAENLIQKKIDENPNNGAAFYGLGYLYYLQGQPEERIVAQFDKAIKLDSDTWEPYFLKYFLYYDAQKTNRAMDSLQTLLVKAQSDNDLERHGNIITSIGYLENITGDYGKAIKHLSTGLSIAAEINDRGLEQSCLANIGVSYQQTGRYLLAIEHYEKALQLARQLGDGYISKAGRTIGLMADLYLEQANYSEAISCYLQAVTMAEQQGDLPAQASHNSNISLAYTKWAKYPLALEYIEKALKFTQINDHPILQGNFLEIRGIIYQQLNQFSDALKDFDDALRLAMKINNNRATALRLTYIGRIQTKLGNREEALNCFQRALKIASGFNDPSEIKATVNLEEYILLGLGELYSKFEEYQQAEIYYNKALSIGREKNLPEIIWQAEEGLATICRANNRLAEARSHFIKSIETIEKVRGALKIDEEKTGFFQDKVDIYNDLIHLLATQAENQSPAYQAEIFHYVEGCRARAFLDNITNTIVKLETGIDERLINQQRQLQARITNIQSQLIWTSKTNTLDQNKITQLSKMLNYADEERLNLQREIRSLYPTYPGLQDSQIAKLEQVQQLLDDQTTLLEYSLGDKYSFLFVVTKQNSFIVALSDTKNITEYVQKLRAAISKPNRAALANYIVNAKLLYQELIQPAAKAIAGKRSLIIVPDGILHYLPFEALLKPDSKNSTSGNFNPLNLLLNDFTISYAPSASVLVKLSSKTKSASAQKLFLGFADPLYPQDPVSKLDSQSSLRQVLENGNLWQLSRLRSSYDEVTGIAQLFPSNQTKLFLQQDACEENVKTENQLDNYQIIHFAVHGLLNSEKPQFSALVFSLPSERPEPKIDPSTLDTINTQQDGLLQVHEIFNLKLNADMVVLSACETGLGKEVKGEGIVGMTRAFLHAGSSSVITSLWKVSDASTASLMVNFYRKLTTHNLSKAEALREAKLEMLQKNNLRHPYYWAPFILTGH